MIHSTSLSAVAANLADVFASRSGILPLVRDWDAGPAEEPAPSWDAEPYDPTPADWADYAAWSQSLDGGCGVAELSPDEEDLLTHTVDEREFREIEAEYDSAKDCEDVYAELWS